MPVGLNDVISLAKFAWNVWNTASSEYTCANQQYQDFVDDIHNLQRALIALQYAATPSPATRSSLRLANNFVESVTSEADKTLKSCERLIRQNPYFKKDGGAVKNIVWAVSVKEDVEKLQTRIQICFHKVNFVVLQQEENNRQADFEVLVANNQNNFEALQFLLQQVADRVGVIATPDISSLLSDTMREKFAETQRSRFQGSDSTIPEKIDSLLIYYERSTHSFVCQPPSMTMPATIQYLNLLKCVYLLEDIRNDPEFRIFRQKPMSAAWWQFHADKIQNEARRFLAAVDGIQRVPNEELLRQNDEEFVVDLKHLQETSELDPVSNNFGQELVMHRTLVSAHSTSVEQLCIHRINANKLRLTKTVSIPTHAHNASTRYHEQELDVQAVSIDPIYAMSQQALPYIVWKSTSSDALAHDLHFTSLQDVKDFQMVITNHVVVSDQDALISGRKKSGVFDGSGSVFAGSGRIQLWSYKDPMRPDMYTKQPLSHRNSITHGPESSQSPSTLQSEATFTQGTLDGLTQMRVLRGGVHGNELIRPMPYQIVIMASTGGKQQLISIRVDEDTYVNPDKCRCSEANSKCREVFIDHKKKKLHIATVASRAANDHNARNLAIFGKVDHHTHHQDLKRAEEEYVKHIVLTFKDIASKDHFARRLRKACLLMLEKYNEYMTAANSLDRMHTYKA